ncbi:MAG: hypothetical protein L6R40_006815 [Gallowayella cf. fulva]|nr:MAG: hypothetical protein L6R40_006815 [Xanthomendoza cf. fulva]
MAQQGDDSYDWMEGLEWDQKTESIDDLFDEMERAQLQTPRKKQQPLKQQDGGMAASQNPSTPQAFFELSHPQTAAGKQSPELGQSTANAPVAASSSNPHPHQSNDAVPGASKETTRPSKSAASMLKQKEEAHKAYLASVSLLREYNDIKNSMPLPKSPPQTSWISNEQWDGPNDEHTVKGRVPRGASV